MQQSLYVGARPVRQPHRVLVLSKPNANNGLMTLSCGEVLGVAQPAEGWGAVEPWDCTLWPPHKPPAQPTGGPGQCRGPTGPLGSLSVTCPLPLPWQYPERPGHPSHRVGCGVGRPQSGTLSPDAGPPPATSADRWPLAHYWLRPGTCPPAPGVGWGGVGWGGGRQGQRGREAGSKRRLAQSWAFPHVWSGLRGGAAIINPFLRKEN
jgi:hypothetical protein